MFVLMCCMYHQTDSVHRQTIHIFYIYYIKNVYKSLFYLYFNFVHIVDLLPLIISDKGKPGGRVRAQERNAANQPIALT